MKKRSYKVLLIDDEPEDFSVIFSSDRWKLTKARNEEEANSQLKSSTIAFDGILLDLALRGSPSFDRGLVFLKKLKDKVGTSIPIVVIAEDFREDMMIRSLNQGAAGFFRKGAYHASWIENQFLKIIHTFQGKPFIAGDLFFSKMPALIKKRELLLNQLLDNSEKRILSISGAIGTGKQFLVRFLKKSGVNIGLFDFAKHSPLAPSQFESYDTIAINSISQTSRDQQKSLYTQAINSNKSFLFIIDDTFDSYYDSGLIIEEIFNLVSIHPKIELYKLADRTIDIPDLIQSFVSDPKVCPRHLPYFCNAADRIFTKEVLELLVQQDWKSNIRELRYLVQYAICQATKYGVFHGNYPEIIDQNYLPKRYLLASPVSGHMHTLFEPSHNKIPFGPGTSREPIRDSKLDYSQEEMPATMQFLSKLEEALYKSANSLAEAAKKLNLDENFIREELKRTFKDNPQIFTKQMYTNIFITFEIVIFICYAEGSKDLYEDIKKHTKIGLEGKFGRIEDKNSIFAGEETKLELELKLNKSHIVCFIICADLLISDELEVSVPLNHFNNTNLNDKVFIPVIAKPCNWESIHKFTKLVPLPKDKVPISASTQKDEALKNVAQEIHRVIDKLRFDKYRAQL